MSGKLGGGGRGPVLVSMKSLYYLYFFIYKDIGPGERNTKTELCQCDCHVFSSLCCLSVNFFKASKVNKFVNIMLINNIFIYFCKNYTSVCNIECKQQM